MSYSDSGIGTGVGKGIGLECILKSQLQNGIEIEARFHLVELESELN